MMTDENEHGRDEILIFVTTPDSETARRIAAVLVSKRRAACVSLISGVSSLYRWKDRVEESVEVLLMIKSRSHCFDDIVELVTENHPYDVPEIVAAPVTRIDARYGQWMHDVITPIRRVDR